MWLPNMFKITDRLIAGVQPEELPELSTELASLFQ